MRITGLAVSTALTALLVSGCAAGGPSEGDPGPDGPVVEVEGDDQSATLGAGLPESFPEWVVLPPDYTVTFATEQVQGGATGYTLQGLSDAGPDEVIAIVESAYDVAPTGGGSSGGITSVSYEDVNGHYVSYTVTTNADGATVVTMDVLPR